LACFDPEAVGRGARRPVGSAHLLDAPALHFEGVCAAFFGIPHEVIVPRRRRCGYRPAAGTAIRGQNADSAISPSRRSFLVTRPHVWTRSGQGVADAVRTGDSSAVAASTIG